MSLLLNEIKKYVKPKEIPQNVIRMKKTINNKEEEGILILAILDPRTKFLEFVDEEIHNKQKIY
ncbi:13152_t:CDS:2 [Funneliformis geosporum]|uniref:13152_t:CDS:1 n=1 Tax=Funneliformis geosporum TaxID=1117311 RepID=A0A9W4SW70_9GLOM|nr:13152_t:CDS:2 [Funneliformis geosporum]